MPGDALVLEVEAPDATWHDALADALRGESVAVRETGAPVVRIQVTRVAGEGHTPAGTVFRSVRFDAEVHLGRAQASFRGAPSTADAAPDEDAARNDLIDRLVAALAY